MSAGSKPGPGWYYDHSRGKWREITPEEREEAREYVEKGYVQTSAKYRAISLLDRAVQPWKEIDSRELTLGVFASFKEQREVDREVQAYRAREEKRPRAKRIVALCALLREERAEELILDLLEGNGNGVEFRYSRELGIDPASPSWHDALISAARAMDEGTLF